MRVAALAAFVALVAAGGALATDWRDVETGGVQVRVAAGWARVLPADVAEESDLRAVLVVGTKGVSARESRCQVSAYRVPADGAAVVVIGARGLASPAIPRTRDGLQQLRLEREYFDCFDGRGAAAQIALRGRAYQINVLVGDRAAPQTIQQALAIARSFGLAAT
jgi:hypothetical protein